MTATKPVNTALDSRAETTLGKQPAPNATTISSFWRRTHIVLGAFLCCLTGVAVLPAVRYLGREPYHADCAEATGAELDELPVEMLRRPDEEIQLLDEWIRQGRYEDALARCQPLIEAATAATCNALEYRAGLCQEGLGRLPLALEAYRAIASRGGFTRAGAAAQLGQARCWLRLGRAADAKALLSTLILRSAEPSLHDQALLSDAYYLLAIALTMEATPAGKPGPFDDNTMAHPIAELPVELMLGWVTLTEPVSEAEERHGQEFVTVCGTGTQPEEALVSAAVTRASVVNLLEKIAGQAGLEPRWSDDARRQLAGRSLKVRVEQMPLPDLLRTIAVTAGLRWQLSAQTLVLALDPLPSDRHAASGLASVARRSLQDAIVTFPDHPLLAAAYLELGNLEAHRGRWPEAIVWYERMLRELPRSSLFVAANFNLGLAQTRLKQRAAARNAFYWVVDRSPGHELAPLAYLHIGRLFLEDNDPAGAARPLRRALTAAPQSTTLAAAAVTLAAAALLADNPRVARATLREARAALTTEPYHSTAAFLDALARYWLLPESQRGPREAGEVLAAVVAFRNLTILGPAGALLIGRAYRDLGMVEEMAATYEAALPTLDCPLALEMTADLADHLYRTGQRREARARYETLAAQPGPNAFPAGLRLAEISLQDRQTEDCLKRCRTLLREYPTAELTPVLQVMAKAYAQRGDHEKAAQCFAGKVPEL